jgi:hypothetical protein
MTTPQEPTSADAVDVAVPTGTPAPALGFDLTPRTERPEASTQVVVNVTLKANTYATRTFPASAIRAGSLDDAYRWLAEQGRYPVLVIPVSLDMGAPVDAVSEVVAFPWSNIERVTMGWEEP